MDELVSSPRAEAKSMEKIVDVRVQRQYLIKWQDEEEATWVDDDIFVGLSSVPQSVTPVFLTNNFALSGSKLLISSFIYELPFLATVLYQPKMEIMLQKISVIGTMRNGELCGTHYDAQSDALSIRHCVQQMPYKSRKSAGKRQFPHRSK